ncbi:MAG: ATP-binding protein [Oscillospiraceae bacterium]|nr:ATP-binding protein [Oscillospiraceae bacterium]
MKLAGDYRGAHDKLEAAIDLFVNISTLLGIGMIVAVARKSQRAQVRSAFLLLLGLATVWNIGHALETDIRLLTGVTHMAFVYICYVGICFVPVAILYLGITIVRTEWSMKLWHFAFFVVPIVSIIIVFTSSFHQLFFVKFSLYSSDAVYGPYYYFHSIYSYCCIAVGIACMYVSSARNSGFLSRQTLFILGGIVVTLVPNVLYSFGVGHLPFSISSAAITVSILCFAISFFRYRFIDTPPVSPGQIIDLISDGYLVVDKELKILAYNRALLRMFPERSGPILGESLRVFVERYAMNVTFKQILTMHERAMAEKTTVTEEIHIRGDTYLNMEITPIAQRNAPSTGSIMIFKDITESKLLLEATKAAGQAKSDFLSYMSHEIRSPLTAIIGMINIGRNTDDIEKLKYCFERADAASRQLLGIINDILDISKIEADKFELAFNEVDFRRMLMDLVDVISARVEEKNINLKVDFNENLPISIETDKLRLSQVITNLLTNAVKFTPENGTITLSAEQVAVEDGEATIRVAVTDTGIGISKEQQGKLFTSFQQANAAISQTYGGTGLGLSISKRIVDLMGGEIWVESEPGRGSKFIFSIKAKCIAAGDSADGTAASASDACSVDVGDGADLDLSAFKLLIAEDIEINQEIMAAILEDTKVSIDFADNGKTAVAAVSDNPGKYDAILMDIQMPEMDGYDATRAIRALDDERAKSVPIIAMTANVFKEDIDKCIACGMDDHIGKPISIEALMGVLAKYLQRC